MERENQIYQSDPEKKEAEPLPEAPVSIHIDGYFHGFHVGITQRDPERQQETFALIKNAKDLIGLMEKDGWDPSWNRETNLQIRGPKPVESKVETKDPQRPPTLCATHNVPMKERTGKQGQTFYSHGRKVDGKFEWCSGKGFPGE